MTYAVIYDGNCNLCTTLVQVLEGWDPGDRFQYIPMQDVDSLKHLRTSGTETSVPRDSHGITAQDCEKGLFLINTAAPEQRWQGSDAVEEIGRLLPMGGALVALYQGLPGPKWLGDQVYEKVRDNRYAWFGERSETYRSPFQPVKQIPAQGAPAADRGRHSGGHGS